MELQLDRKVQLRELNEHISCFICGGYLIDATTLTECLHTFCKSCIVTHIEDEDNMCPRCRTVIHHSYPLQYISFDRTMQDIVDKLVPNLQESEFKRRLHYYKSNKLPLPDEIKAICQKRNIPNHSINDLKEDGKKQNFHKFDEQIDVYLRSTNCQLRHLKRPFLQCSVHATIKILKKFLAKNLGYGADKYAELDILCNEEILGKDHTLHFIMVTRWRQKKLPLHLEYRPRITMLQG